MWKSVPIFAILFGLSFAGIIHDHYEPQQQQEDHQEYGGLEEAGGHYEYQPEHESAVIAGGDDGDHGHGGSLSEHHSEVKHEHATSHQSFKIHHFHPVPVYIKKEDQHYLKNPVKIAETGHKHKLIHPETEQHHGHGLTLENHDNYEDYRILDNHGYQHEEQEEEQQHQHQPIYEQQEEKYEYPEYVHASHH